MNANVNARLNRIESDANGLARDLGIDPGRVAPAVATAMSYLRAAVAALAGDGLQGLSAGGPVDNRTAQKQRIQEWSGRRQLSAVGTAGPAADPTDEPDDLDRRVRRPAGADQPYPTSTPRQRETSPQRQRIREHFDKRRKREAARK